MSSAELMAWTCERILHVVAVGWSIVIFSFATARSMLAEVRQGAFEWGWLELQFFFPIWHCGGAKCSALLGEGEGMSNPAAHVWHVKYERDE